MNPYTCHLPVTGPTPDANGDINAVEAETYRMMRDIATEHLGYPSILEALEATPPYSDANGWLPIESAPRDGTRVDLWVVDPQWGDASRVVDCHWSQDWKPEGVWLDPNAEYGDTGELYGNPTHFRFPPPAPLGKGGDNE